MDNYLVNTTDSEPSNFKGSPDGKYVRASNLGFSAMTFPGSGQAVALNPITGKGSITITVTTTAPDAVLRT
jgi:hypothetical protein